MKKLIILCLLVIFCFIFSINFINYNNSDNTSSGNNLLVKNPTIIIDAGHGGFDGGTSTDDGVTEKGINLNISLFLKDYLEFFGFNVVMTRESDTSTESEGLTTIRSKKTSDLHNRMTLMESTDNAVFVSIHQNHFSSSKYKGAQVFYSSNFSEQSSLLAENIQDSIVYYLQKDNTRQIKPCGTSVYLIYKAVKPAVLVECGFLSNEEDALNLQNEIYQRKMALCIAIGILNYCEGQ
ncbi:MAG: N-acetylmuramoyl-L-alanine amidase [Clostridia bacterium]|nr:N-acetylmuramoyl-L-alanine amidase [Clostridia bacterium]